MALNHQLLNALQSRLGMHCSLHCSVVFHDSFKAEEKLRYALPKTLAHFAALGYRFEALNDLEMQSGMTERKSA